MKKVENFLHQNQLRVDEVFDVKPEATELKEDVQECLCTQNKGGLWKPQEQGWAHNIKEGEETTREVKKQTAQKYSQPPPNGSCAFKQ